jgi:hypothetical protein
MSSMQSDDPSPFGGGESTVDSDLQAEGWSDLFSDSFGMEDVAGELMWDSLGDGYYTHQEMKDLAKIVTAERREQHAIELSTENARKWIKYGNQSDRVVWGSEHVPEACPHQTFPLRRDAR